jgi:hypothetical protein
MLVPASGAKLLFAFNTADSSGKLWTEQAGIGSFVCQPPDRGKALIHGSSCQAEGFQVKATSENHSPIQGKSRLGTIPGNKLLHRELVVSPGMWGTETVEYRRFCMIQIREFQDDLAAVWPPVSFAHISGLHAADMHKMDP